MSRIVVCIALFFALVYCAYSQLQQSTAFAVRDMVALDSSLNQKRLLLPRVFRDTLFVLENEAKVLDSRDSYYVLHNIHSGSMQHLVLPADSAHRKHIVQYFVEENSVILVDLVSLMFFARSDDGTWRLATYYPLSFTVFYALKEKNILYLWNDVPSSSSGKKSHFYCYSYDIEQGKEGEIVEFPESANAALMYVQPRNVLDRTARSIALSDITTYSIRVYNADTSVCDTMRREPESWVQLKEAIHIPRYNRPIQQYFPLLDSIRKTASMVHRISLLSDTNLLVLWSVPQQKDGKVGMLYFVDIWSKRKGKWELTKHDVPLNAKQDDTPFTVSDSPLPVSYTLTNGIFIHLVPYPMDSSFTTSWKNYAEYEHHSNAYFATHALQYVALLRECMP